MREHHHNEKQTDEIDATATPFEERLDEHRDRPEPAGDDSIQRAIEALRDPDCMEKMMYIQTVEGRIKAIKTLRERMNRNTREQAIRAHVPDHLWLLDPSWERANASQQMAERVDALLREVNATLSDEEKSGHLATSYRKTAGKHVVIVLKQPEQSFSVYDLCRQIWKYRCGLIEILEESDLPREPLEFICVLGTPPVERNAPHFGQSKIEQTLDATNARYVTYDQLLDDASQAYASYLGLGHQQGSTHPT